MIRTSRGLTSSSGAAAGSGIVVGRTGASATVIGRSLLLAEDEAEHAAVHGLLDKEVAGRLRPGLEVLDGAGVRGHDLEGLAGREALDRLRGLDDRHRAVQPAGVQLQVG